MSNELSTILKDISSMPVVQTGLDDDTRAVAGSGAGQTKRISIEAGVFRKIVGGKEVATIEDRHMNVIFVKMAHHPSRTYYSQTYKKGVKISPTCWSNDSITPDTEVTKPVASKCENCPMSVKGSAQNGQSSACRLSWRTAVVLPSDPSGDVMQLTIPAASVWGQEVEGKFPFRPYVQMLANNNISAGRVVTKMQFDMKSSAPRLLFSPVAGIDASDAEVLLRQSKSNSAEQAIKLTVYQADSASTEDNEEFVTSSPAPVDVVESDVDEPTVRASEANNSEPVRDASDVIKKWSKKG